MTRKGNKSIINVDCGLCSVIRMLVKKK